MKQIELTQGKIAIVDDCDYEWLSQWKWHYNSGRGYAARNSSRPNQKTLWMHHVILEHAGIDFIHIDHIDRDKLNNRRKNLRPATLSQNQWNQKKYRNNTSGFKGVYKNRNKWCAQIRVNGKRIHIGYFVDLKEAALAYNEAAKKYHGEFSCLNEVG